MAEQKYIHGVWENPWYFIGAVLCASSGLGALWLFPAATTRPDIGLVILLYPLFLVVVGWPLLLAEAALGRRARQSPIGTMRYLVRESQQHKLWRSIGWLSVSVGVLVASWCSQLLVWSGHYFVDMATGLLQGQNLKRATEHFQQLHSQSGDSLLWAGIFLLICSAVVAGGVPRIGRAFRHLVAVLIWLLVLAMALSCVNGAWLESYHHLFDLPPEPFSIPALLQAAPQAMGLALTTLVMGTGVAMSYGAYASNRSGLAKSSLLVVLLMGLVALSIALIVHAALLSFPDISYTSGYELMYVALPMSFSNMVDGLFLGALFYLFVMLAVWGSVISLLEPATAWLVERTRCNRPVAALLVGVVCYALVSASIYLQHLMTAPSAHYGVVERLVSQVLLPLIGLLVAVFTGWLLKRSLVREMLFDETRMLFAIWYGMLRYILPLAMVIILAAGIYGLF